MTEADWLTATDPDSLLRHAAGYFRENPRKLRLLACAWGYTLWPRMPAGACREAVLVAERYADGVADLGELVFAFRAADELFRAMADNRVRGHGRGTRQLIGRWATMRAVKVARASADPALAVGDLSARDHTPTVQYALTGYIRDLIGKPFRPPAIDPRWRTADVLGVAAAAYDDGAFGLLPVLADALEEAGCENADMLGHCRDPQGVHVRGCWVIDLLLGKE